MSYQPKVYRKQGGNETVVASGGAITVESGGDLVVAAGGRLGVAGKLVPTLAVTNLATVGAGTYTAAALAGGIITRDPAGAGRVDTTDTAVAIIAAMGLEATGDIGQCDVINTADAAEAITLAGGTDVTISNVGQTIAQNESARLVFRRTSATAVTLYILGA